MEFNESWVQIASLFLANVGLIIWFRSESRANWGYMDNKLDANIRSIQQEMRDFHGKLERQDAELKYFLRAYLGEKYTNKN